VFLSTRHESKFHSYIQTSCVYFNLHIFK
jgi:hypothetical protein